MKQCGAKTRSGGKCKTAAMSNGRCRLHGGMSTGAKDAARPGNINALKHGIYSRQILPEEVTLYDEMELGSVDHELRLSKIRLMRVLEAEQKANGGLELEEVTDNIGAGNPIPDQVRRSKVKDYNYIVDRLLARIESLEKTRKMLTEGGGGDLGNTVIIGFEVVPYDD